MTSNDEWTVVGQKGSSRRGKSGRALTLKHANDLNSQVKANRSAELLNALSAQGTGSETSGNAAEQSRQQEKSARKWGKSSSDRVQAAKDRIERGLEELQRAPFYEKLCRHFSKHFLVDKRQERGNDTDSEGHTRVQESSQAEFGNWRWISSCEGLPNVVVYGLGSVTGSGLEGRAQAYDPVSTEVDDEVLAAYGIQSIKEDEGGARTATSHTIFFMPHCEARLYDNLLQANWSEHQLAKVTIIGNSFKTYEDRWDLKSLTAEGRPKHILALAPYSIETPFGETGEALAQSFNDTSIILFPSSSLPTDPKFWNK
ncbi:sensitivity to red-light reduced protein, variant 2 [Cymbomonas tetramitiformis]|uniref:Sensitivity to red-light reduced protein, variant 2 n=1 Tax=Cymbomonas tetramitiformis TaxID=36881 RepID=A0AAE0BYW8_9CHLO|nr:sensitivity to red-light reduced protein, variant 2 [Cymbomonas tetramitiformis]